MMDGETSFAEFEAKANAAPEAAPDPKPEAEAAAAAPAAETADKPLELTEADEAVDVPEGEEGGEEHDDAEGKRRRSKPASQRIAELTAKLRQAERERDELRGDKPAEEAKAPDKPDPAQFEFGEADPAYIEALTDWKLDSREAERAKATEAQREQREMVQRIETGVQKAEVDALAKYDDFAEKLDAAVEARGGEPLPPLLSVGISVSPVGGDLLYRLATDEAAATKLEALAKGGAQTANALALAMGELEGEYLGDDDSDLDLTDGMDMARMLGRMKARLAGKRATKPKAEVKVTEAPEPPADRARGGTGRFEVGADTSDFAAFERKVNGRR